MREAALARLRLALEAVLAPALERRPAEDMVERRPVCLRSTLELRATPECCGPELLRRLSTVPLAVDLLDWARERDPVEAMVEVVAFARDLD